MRISTSTIFSQGVASIQDQTAKVYKAQQQISSGKKILAPSDDPVGSARALEITQSQSINDQYVRNAGTAQDLLNQQETALSQVTSVIQSLQTAVVQGGNGALSNNDRQSLAASVQQGLQELVDLANSTDDTGGYLFSGYQEGVRPFSQVGNVVNYNGDNGQRLVQISDSRQIPATDSGAAVFARIKNGNGTYVTGADASNQGAGTITVGTVTNPADPNLNLPVTIRFTSATTYDVTDAAGNPLTPPLNNQAYTSGNSITVQGKTFAISGAPQAGDKFTVAPSANQSLFKTVSNLAQALQTPVTDGASAARLDNQLSQASADLSAALTHILNQRASVGARLNEITARGTTAQDMSLQYSTSLSQIQDVDYTQAASDLARNQLTLQAAQQSFVKIQNLSLFNFLS